MNTLHLSAGQYLGLNKPYEHMQALRFIDPTYHQKALKAWTR